MNSISELLEIERDQVEKLNEAERMARLLNCFQINKGTDIFNDLIEEYRVKAREYRVTVSRARTLILKALIGLE